MKLPEGLTEAQVVEVIENVGRRLAKKYRFGYHGIDDKMQEAAQFALEALDKWDGVRPLENFLWTHVRNRLFNEKRNKLERPDKPCLTCPLYDMHCLKSSNQCEKYDDKMDCELYSRWVKRNSKKRNIMEPVNIEIVHDEEEANMKTSGQYDVVDKAELWAIIDKHLDIKLRSDYLKMRSGVKIVKQKRMAVEQAILEIVREHYDGDE